MIELALPVLSLLTVILARIASPWISSLLLSLHYKVCYSFARKERQLREQLGQMINELKSTPMVEEFVKYSKLKRRIDSLKKELEPLENSRNQRTFLLKSVTRSEFTGCHMTNFQTLVFFDLETTGLPDSLPRIAELALVAVHRQSLLNCRGQLPRVMNQLNLTFYPMKMFDASASAVNGLDNFNLECQKDFDVSAVELLRCFFKRLDSPVVLIAHNGDRFDFPLLKAELEAIDESLFDNILCVDSGKMLTNDFGEPYKLNSSNSSSSGVSSTESSPMKMPSLTKCYQTIHNQLPRNLHSSLGDCLTLLQVLIASSHNLDRYFTYIDDNAVNFNQSVKRMYNLRKRKFNSVLPYKRAVE